MRLQSPFAPLHSQWFFYCSYYGPMHSLCFFYCSYSGPLHSLCFFYCSCSGHLHFLCFFHCSYSGPLHSLCFFYCSCSGLCTPCASFTVLTLRLCTLTSFFHSSSGSLFSKVFLYFTSQWFLKLYFSSIATILWVTTQWMANMAGWIYEAGNP